MLYISLPALFQGFGLGAGLIVVIGAQNVFVLHQGIKQQYVFITAGIFTLCDTVLILLGVGGLGSLITAFPPLLKLVTWGGALFLLWYGFRSFRSMVAPMVVKANKSATGMASLRHVILMVFTLSLLNPHTYLDTVVLIGSVGAHYPSRARASFALGATLASWIWFFGLAYGASWLAPLFQSVFASHEVGILASGHELAKSSNECRTSTKSSSSAVEQSHDNATDRKESHGDAKQTHSHTNLRSDRQFSGRRTLLHSRISCVRLISLDAGLGWTTRVWRILDGLTGCIMWMTAFSLIWSALHR